MNKWSYFVKYEINRRHTWYRGTIWLATFMAQAILTLTLRQGHMYMSKSLVTDMEVSTFFDCFLLLIFSFHFVCACVYLCVCACTSVCLFARKRANHLLDFEESFAKWFPVSGQIGFEDDEFRSRVKVTVTKNAFHNNKKSLDSDKMFIEKFQTLACINVCL